MRLGVGGRAHLAQDGRLAAPPLTLTLTLNPNPGAHPNPFTLTMTPWSGHVARGRDGDLPRAARAAEVRPHPAPCALHPARRTPHPTPHTPTPTPYTRPLSRCVYARDALTKAIYASLFDWAVRCGGDRGGI